MKRTKIVATLGPATSERGTIRDLLAAGVDVIRLNLSHGEHEFHRRLYELVREEEDRAGRPVAVLADLRGPKIRVGEMADGAVELVEGSSVTITSEPVLGTPQRISTWYAELPREVTPGDRIFLDDGEVRLRVEDTARTEVHCRVEVGGRVGSRQGMNLPGVSLSTPALTAKDRHDMTFAVDLGVDYFALSFVRRSADLEEAKRHAGGIPVIAKIEKPEAVERREGIVAAADGLMVARGDLGVEVGVEKVPLIQKQLIRDAAAGGKPVIVATQMLESMISSATPTRAEVSDVANAVLDGADALMLSGETAVGKYPVEAVRKMAQVIEEVERSDLYRLRPEPLRLEEYSFSNAVARAAVNAARDLELAALVVYTESGHTAELVSAYRPPTPLLALTRHPAVLRRLALRWGVRAVGIERWSANVAEAVDQVERVLTAHAVASAGDDVAITLGVEEMSGPGRTNMLKLWRLRGEKP